MDRRLLTVDDALADLDALPEPVRTADVDRLIRRYVREQRDLSCLREHVLAETRLHRVYFHGTLKQIPGARERLEWIDRNLLFADWWHTDENIDFVKDADIGAALRYARRYVADGDPFIRRWGYVMFISKLCRNESALTDILALTHDDDHYYVQMAEAWLIAELAVFFPELVRAWLPRSGLKYGITGKAVRKICDSYRIAAADKARFKMLRPTLKQNR